MELDLETIGYFLYMEEQENKDRYNNIDQEQQEERENNNG
jgi:hypothetical protein